MNDLALQHLDRFEEMIRVVKTAYAFADIKPEAKQSARVGAGGRVYTDAKKRRYVKMLGDLLRDSFKAEKFSGVVRVTAIYSFPWREADKKVARVFMWQLMDKRPDIDNLYKPLADALQGCAFADDSTVAEVRARKIRSGDMFIAVRIDEIVMK